MLRYTMYPIIEAMNTRWFANNVSFKLIGGSFKDEALKFYITNLFNDSKCKPRKLGVVRLT